MPDGPALGNPAFRMGFLKYNELAQINFEMLHISKCHYKTPQHARAMASVPLARPVRNSLQKRGRFRKEPAIYKTKWP